MLVVVISTIVLALGYCVLRANARWIYRVLDRALDNPRDRLPDRYDLPRYLTRDARGDVATDEQWPGWDGWYFVVLPDPGCPFAMIRGSIMTGLYGLDGVDDYDKLDPTGQSPSGNVEYLNIAVPRDRADTVHVWQEYLPKHACLDMSGHELDVSVDSEPGAERVERGRINGRWPSYAIDTTNPAIGLVGSFRASADKLVWWADAPGVFTYFAAFARFEGTVAVRDPATGQLVLHAVSGRGCIEHGCARKPFRFDGLWAPVRLIKRAFPGFRPIRYHYELFLSHEAPRWQGDQPCMRGGFMHARGFGITARNRGGVHIGDDYVAIHGVDIDYLDFDDGCIMPARWRVRARTDHGPLCYEATRVGQPAAITDHMAYYHYTYDGEFRGAPIAGAGYGEYLHI